MWSWQRAERETVPCSEHFPGNSSISLGEKLRHPCSPLAPAKLLGLGGAVVEGWKLFGPCGNSLSESFASHRLCFRAVFPMSAALRASCLDTKKSASSLRELSWLPRLLSLGLFRKEALSVGFQDTNSYEIAVSRRDSERSGLRSGRNDVQWDLCASTLSSWP